MVNILTPLYLQMPELVTDPPAAVECPVCFAIVRESRLGDHERASHG